MPDEAALRLTGADLLREIVDGGDLDLCVGVDALILDGRWDRRVETVLAHIRAGQPA